MRGNGRTTWKVRPMPMRQISFGLMPMTTLALEHDLARVRRGEAVQQVEERSLAGAVRADDAEHLASATSKLTS